VKRKGLKKIVVVPSIPETIPKGLEEEEEDPEDTIPLSQRTRVAVVAVEERKKSLTPPSLTTQDEPIQVYDVTEEEGCT
jgi:hypothetical protein